jgi:hypothetical protein
LSGRRAGELVLPTKPLGMDARRCGTPRARATRRHGARRASRVEDLATLDSRRSRRCDAAGRVAQTARRAEPSLEPSPIVSVHLLFDRKVLASPLAALLGSDAHWVFDRGALTGHEPDAGPVPHGRLERRPELMEVRGRELVDRIAAQVTEALGSPSSCGLA